MVAGNQPFFFVRKLIRIMFKFLQAQIQRFPIGALNIADVVLLQKWLLAVPGIKLGEGEVADLYEDGNLNVLDLAVMKQKLSIQ